MFDNLNLLVLRHNNKVLIKTIVNKYFTITFTETGILVFKHIFFLLVNFNLLTWDIICKYFIKLSKKQVLKLSVV